MVGVSQMKFYSYQIAKEERVGEETRLVFSRVMKQVSPETLEIVKREAYNGEYTIEDDGQPEPSAEPTQLDRVEAQATYTAMMTETLLEG